MDRDALKVMLRSATTTAERTEAVEIAVRLGMSLREIEEYLDWLDLNRCPQHAIAAVATPT
jgi:hypothetical protein